MKEIIILALVVGFSTHVAQIYMNPLYTVAIEIKNEKIEEVKILKQISVQLEEISEKMDNIEIQLID